MKTTWIWKPLASTAFLVFAWQMGAMTTPYGRLIFTGLCLSWIGDILLIPESKTSFLAGLFSFLLAHILYSAAFWTLGQEGPWAILAACLAVVTAVIVGRWLLPHVARVSPSMRLPVLAYMTTISIMVILSVGAAVKIRAPLLFAGAFLFYLSDLSVARDKFVSPGPVNRLWGLPLYYVAQFVLAFTIRIVVL